MKPLDSRTERLTFYALGLILVVLTYAAYAPYIENQLVFDDTTFFYRQGIISHYAITPFDLHPRTFPYFTFSFIQAIFQSFEAQRIFNIALHCINSLLLFSILAKVAHPAHSLRDFADPSDGREISSLLLPFSLASAFALHPVSVYGTAYLVQRTILFATLFSLLSMSSFLRHLSDNSLRSLLLSALFASAAIFSKEHAFTLPLAMVFLIPAASNMHISYALPKAALFVLLCSPAMLAAFLHSKGIVSATYEPHAELFDEPSGTMLWLRSILTQCWLYFSYIRLWLVPDTALMSIDIRVALVDHWLSLRAIAGGVLLAATTALSLFLVFRGGRYRLVGFGLIFTIVLFSIEFATIRTQEPFVLYRSYLWAPGLLISIFSLAIRIPGSIALAVIFCSVPLLTIQAQDRLASLATSRSVWQDAASKLESEMLPGAFRIYYNRGLSYLGSGEYEPALADMELCNMSNNRFPGCHIGKAVIYERMKAHDKALAETEAALLLAPRSAAAWEIKGRQLRTLGRQAEAHHAFSVADSLGGSLGSLLRKQATVSNDRGLMQRVTE